MEIILLKQFHIDIIKNNKVYLYYKIMKEFPAISVPYLKYVDVFNKVIKTILSLH